MQITICDDTERAGNLDYIAGLVNSCFHDYSGAKNDIADGFKKKYKKTQRRLR